MKKQSNKNDAKKFNNHLLLSTIFYCTFYSLLTVQHFKIISTPHTLIKTFPKHFSFQSDHPPSLIYNSWEIIKNRPKLTQIWPKFDPFLPLKTTILDPPTPPPPPSPPTLYMGYMEVPAPPPPSIISTPKHRNRAWKWPPEIVFFWVPNTTEV